MLACDVRLAGGWRIRSWEDNNRRKPFLHFRQIRIKAWKGQSDMNLARDSANAAIAELLLLDADMALSFIEYAEADSEKQTRMRRLNAAKKAYERVVKPIPRASLTTEHAAFS